METHDKRIDEGKECEPVTEKEKNAQSPKSLLMRFWEEVKRITEIIGKNSSGPRPPFG